MPSIEPSLQDSLVSSLIRRVFISAGHIFIRRLEKAADRASEANRETLRKILQRNQNTRFGREHAFAQALASPDLESAYRQQAPVRRYADFEADIERIKRGESNILIADAVTGIAASAGTTGAMKMVPVTAAHLRPAVQFMGMMEGTIAHRHFLGGQPRQKGICLLSYAGKPLETESGLKVGAASGMGIKKMKPMLHHIWVSPPDTYTVEDDATARYLHALYGLRYRQTEYVIATFAPYVLQWIAVMLDWWEELVEDIELGTLSQRLVLPEDTRKRLEAGLTPDPRRAAEVRRAFEAGFEGILPRLWPNLKYIDSVVTGSFAIHQPALNYYAGGVPLYSSFYGMSEVSIGVGLWPDRLGEYMLFLGAAYYEFIQVEDGEFAGDHPDAPPRTVTLEDLESGKYYEVVVTTYAGLYRYRTGDVIKMVGHYKSAPVIQFSHRRGLAMDLVSEKTTEQQVRAAVEGLLPAWLGERAALRDFTTSGDVDSIVPQYVFYLELIGLHHEKAKATLDEAAALIDKALRTSNYLYYRCRKRGVLGAPKVKLVEPGTFDALQSRLVERHPTQNRTQIKIPVNLKAKELVSIMEDRVLAESMHSRLSAAD